MTLSGAGRHFGRAVDVVAERTWRAIGLRRFIEWLSRALAGPE